VCYEGHIHASSLYAALHTNVEIRTLRDITRHLMFAFCLSVFLPNPLSSLSVSVSLSASLFCFRFFHPVFRVSCLYRSINVKATPCTQAYPDNDDFMEADQRKILPQGSIYVKATSFIGA